MYVSATSSRFSRGRLTPAIRANFSLLALSLLVPRVAADDQHLAVPLDHAAAVTHRLDGRSNFHLRTLRQPRQSSATPRRSIVADAAQESPSVSTSGPLSVTATVCSKWAEREPSSVEIDQRSSAIQTSGLPALIIGSMASVMPGASSGPRPGSPKFGTCGS